MSRAVIVAAVLVAAALAIAPDARAVTGAQAVAALDAQRVAHGFPAGIAEVPAWSDGCAKHHVYQELNGGGLTHQEDPSRPGYTREGADAASRAVLAAGSSWTSGNPWETAPIHLHQLLAPRLARSGAADDERYSCMTTWGGMDRPAPAGLVTYSYPGDGTTHRYAETASEAPYTPGDLVGLPQPRTTGPYLYVAVDAPQGASRARVVAASLTGPEGAVDLRTVDNFTPGLESFLPAGAELIPVDPLKPSSTYRASVALDVELGDGSVVRAERQWSFATIAEQRPPAPPDDAEPATPTPGRPDDAGTSSPPVDAGWSSPVSGSAQSSSRVTCRTATARVRRASSRLRAAERQQRREYRVLRRMHRRGERAGWPRRLDRAYDRRLAQYRKRARRISGLRRQLAGARRSQSRRC